MSELGLYFAYGSNLLPARLAERLGPCALRGVAWLDGYSLRFHKRGRDGSGKGDAYRTGLATDRLYGVLFEVSAAQTERLDGFEGSGYTREQLAVSTSRSPTLAWLYVARATAVDPRLRPYDWYHRLVEQGARSARLPAHYLESIAAVATQPDPDRERARKHFELIASARLD